MSVPIIIAIGVVAFLIILFVIYFDNIKKLFAKKEKKVEKIPEPQKETKQQYSYEDFKPKKPVEPEMDRDTSVSSLFEEYNSLQDDNTEDYIDANSSNYNSINNNDYVNDYNNNSNNFDKSEFDDLFKKFNEGGGASKEKSLSEQISELPPEIKILLIDNLLNKKDDV